MKTEKNKTRNKTEVPLGKEARPLSLLQSKSPGKVHIVDWECLPGAAAGDDSDV